jgi:hypothetical protein
MKIFCEHFYFAYLDFEKFALGYWLTGNLKLRQFLLQQRFLELKMWMRATLIGEVKKRVQRLMKTSSNNFNRA